MPNQDLQEALKNRRSVREFTSDNIDESTLNNILWATQGITDANSNRTTPSAHALHPLRLMVTVARVENVNSGLYRVDPKTLGLDKIGDNDVRQELRSAALDDQTWITDAAAIITICADGVEASRSFVDQQPYGARGLRYVYMEAGAAAQNALLQATGQNLGSVLVAGFLDEATSEVLKLEYPLSPLIHVCLGVGSPQSR